MVWTRELVIDKMETEENIERSLWVSGFKGRFTGLLMGKTWTDCILLPLAGKKLFKVLTEKLIATLSFLASI